MQRDLLKAFETSCGPPRVGDDVMIVCEVKDKAGIVRKRAFFLLAESCGRHGRHAAVQTFLVMSPASLHDALAVSYDGVSLAAGFLKSLRLSEMEHMSLAGAPSNVSWRVDLASLNSFFHMI